MIDLHNDTIMRLLFNKEKGLLKNNDYHVDINKLKRSNSMVECFAMFAPPVFLDRDEIESTTQHELVFEMANRFFEELEISKQEISLIRVFKDIEENRKNGKILALLTIEGAGSIDSKIERIDEYYNLGVRLITLTWNYVNCLGYPNVDNHNEKGLTEFGIEAIKKMNELGIIIDVSHLSDGGFWDVVEYSTKPFIASHSNAREISPHKRNLTDEMIKALAEKGGVIGINFCPAFLTENLESKEMKIVDLVKHIKHIKKVGGINCIALGTDFDGIGGKLEIEDISQMDKLKSALKENGFNEEEIDKIWCKNALRAFKEILK